MTTPLGDFLEDTKVYIPFTSNNGVGGRIPPSDAFEANDVFIYKNGFSTKKVTTNGVTITTSADTKPGFNGIEIDLADDTGDAGFWTKQSVYIVLLYPDSETIDGQLVASAWTFSIEYLNNNINVQTINNTVIDGDGKGTPFFAV